MNLPVNEYQNGLYSHNPGSSTSQIQREMDSQNQIVQRWRPKVRRALKNSARQFNDGKPTGKILKSGRKEKKLINSITSKIKKHDGVADYISFNFERHGIFIHKGVSRGHPISNPRKTVDWFNPVLEKYMPELADKLAEVNANIAIAFEKARIK